MCETLKSELLGLKSLIKNAENAVFVSHNALQDAKRNLQAREDDILLGKIEDAKVDGKNAEVRTAQMREATAIERKKVAHLEFGYEGDRVILSNLRTELQITLALVELVKGDTRFV